MEHTRLYIIAIIHKCRISLHPHTKTIYQLNNLKAKGQRSTHQNHVASKYIWQEGAGLEPRASTIYSTQSILVEMDFLTEVHLGDWITTPRSEMKTSPSIPPLIDIISPLFAHSLAGSYLSCSTLPYQSLKPASRIFSHSRWSETSLVFENKMVPTYSWRIFSEALFRVMFQSSPSCFSWC